MTLTTAEHERASPPADGPRRGLAGVGPLPAFLLRVAVLGAVVAALVLRRDAWSLTSDSVAQQSLVRTWFVAGHGTTYLPPDTWLLKLPVYVAVESLPLAPATRVLVESVVLTLLTVVALGWACAALARQAGAARGTRPSDRRGPLGVLDTLAPFGWFATLAGGIGSYLTSLPNSRNVELGLALVVVAAAGAWLAREPHGRRPRWWRAGAGVGAVFGLGVLWVDDPYVAVLVGAPLAVAAGAWFARKAGRGGRDRRLLGLCAVLVASLVAVVPLRGALAAAGLVVVSDQDIGPTTDPQRLLSHIPVLGPSIAAQLGLRETGTAAHLAHVLAVAVLALGIVAAGAVTIVGWRRGRLAVTFVGLHPIVVVAGVVGSRGTDDFHAGRYLVLAFVDLAACLGLGLTLLRRPAGDASPGQAWPRRLAAGGLALVVVATAVNLVSAAIDDPVPRDVIRAQHREQADVLHLLAVAAAEGATKGAGPFWTSNVYTYLSREQVLISTVTCSRGQLRERQWISETARSRRPAARSVVVVPASGELGCDATEVARAVGRAPLRRLATGTGSLVLVFDGDVTALVRPPAG